MTAPIVTKFGNVVVSSVAQNMLFIAAHRTLERPIRRANSGTLWERIAEGKTR